MGRTKRAHLPYDLGPRRADHDRVVPLDGLAMRGLALHIGSQIFDLDPIERAYAKVGALAMRLRAVGHTIDRVDLGGGLGVPYEREHVPPSPAVYGEMVARVTKDWDVTLMFEPGRVIVGNAGVLLTRVIWVKSGVIRPYVIVDAAMNDLARPVPPAQRLPAAKVPLLHRHPT